MVSASFVKGKWFQNAKKVESKLGPSMLRNKIGLSFDPPKRVMFVFFCSLFLKISSSLQKEEYFWKTKAQKLIKHWPSLTQKRLFLDQVLTLQHIYICYVPHKEERVHQVWPSQTRSVCMSMRDANDHSKDLSQALKAIIRKPPSCEMRVKKSRFWSAAWNGECRVALQGLESRCRVF